MNKMLVCLALMLFAASIALANPPSAITATYDQPSQTLTVILTHPTPAPGIHFIKDVEISQDGRKIVEQWFSEQYNDQFQLVRVLIPRVNNDTQIKVKGTCSLYGSKEVLFTNLIGGTGK